MKKVIILSFVLATIFSCNNNADKKEEKATTATITETRATEIQPDVFKPFNAVLIKHTVNDYEKWKAVFDADSSFRNEAGLHLMGPIGRGLENKNVVEIGLAIDDITRAKAFANNPRLKDVMQKGGVTSAPNISYWKIIRYDAMVDKQNLPYAEREVNVKDFDTWVKAFDAGGGKAQRETEGSLDLALAQGLEDPNKITVVFAITDMNKFKTAMASDAKKKIMADAGVIGKPEMTFFQNEK
ncbi:MAG: hypothetical protein LH615_15495 [Ferruginibacter sp.]|nr:hypothetical protein [Ferruginibacter sp.]